MLTRGQKSKYHFVLFFNRAMGLLPTWFLYGPFMYLLYFILYRVAGYRLKTVRDNLANSFPDKSPGELRSIEKKFYKHLAEIFIDAVDMVSISPKEAKKRIIFENKEAHEVETAGKDWIGALAHYGSWEYFPIYQFYTESQTAGVYRPVHDKAIDAFYRYSRSRFGMDPVSMKVLLRYIVIKKAESDRNIILGMIADQSAHPNDHTLWFDFLGQKTIFYAGVERIAVRFGMPVYYVEIMKERKTRYRASFTQIYDGVEMLPEGEITYRYVKRLEQTIRSAPQYWIWSHKRWKNKFGPGCRLYVPQTDGMQENK